MSSYKPVIYTFAAIGLLGAIGLGVATVKLVQQASLMSSPYSSDYMMDSYGSDSDFSDLFSTSSDPYLNESPFGAMTDPENAGSMADGSYLGTVVAYQTLQDPSLTADLKLPDTMDLTLRSLLTRPDTTLQEIFQSDTRLALKMTALNQEMQTIIVQNLETGDLYDTNVNAQNNNFKLLGPQIVYTSVSASGVTPVNELNQVLIYNIETNETLVEPALATGSSYVKTLNNFGPVANLRTNITNGTVEVSVYAASEALVAGKDRTATRTISYPTIR